MNDEETVALIAGGHTFGKTHGAGDRNGYVGPEPEAARSRSRAWAGATASAPARPRRDHQRHGGDLDATTPTQWGNSFFEQSVRVRVGAEQEPGRRQPVASRRTAAVPAPCPDPPDPAKTADAGDADDRPRAAGRSGLRGDLAAVLEHPDELADAFARAWFKLTHRDMGPIARYLGPLVPRRGADLAGPGAGGRSGDLIERSRDRRAEGGGSSPRACRSPSWSTTAWASASTFRGTDKRGGANGARDPAGAAEGLGGQRPAQLARGARHAGGDPREFDAAGRQAGLARRPDRARRRRGGRAGRARTPGTRSRCRSRRAAPTRPQEQTDVESFAPCSSRRADGFRNYLQAGVARPAELLVERANLLTLSAPGDDGAGRRPARARRQRRRLEARRVHRPAGRVDQRLLRQPARHGHGVEAGVGRGRRIEGRDRATGELEVDRQPRSTSCSARTRNCARSPRSTPATTRARSSSRDFVAAWDKVMNLDRFDLA